LQALELLGFSSFLKKAMTRKIEKETDQWFKNIYDSFQLVGSLPCLVMKFEPAGLGRAVAAIDSYMHIHAHQPPTLAYTQLDIVHSPSHHRICGPRALRVQLLPAELRTICLEAAAAGVDFVPQNSLLSMSWAASL
jgi:hypothetical protein